MRFFPNATRTAAATRSAMPLALALLLTAGLHMLTGCNGKPPAEIKTVAGQAQMHDNAQPTLAETDWPWWRGPKFNGVAPDAADPPLTWSETENVTWKVNLPGRGHASPVVVGDRIFIATADESAQTQSLIAYNRDDGNELWTKQLHQGKFIPMHAKNSHASATPVCDGQHVFTVFAIDDAVWLSKVSLDGELVWQKRVGDFNSRHGYGSSPVIYRSAIIVAADHFGAGPGYLAALDRETGDLVWRAGRPENASYSTPVVATVAGRKQLLIHAGNKTTAYNPDNGEQLWIGPGPSKVTANTIVWDDARIYVSGGYPEKNLLALEADGQGDVGDTKTAWQVGRAIAYVPSSLVHDGRLYTVDDQGIAACYNPETGDILWRERLGQPCSASPVLAAGRIYIPSERGATYVFQPGDEFKLLAENKLPTGAMATPAFTGPTIFLRTKDALYRIDK